MKIQLRRRLRRAVESRLDSLPGLLRSRVYRGSIRLDLAPRPGLEIRVARSFDEHMGAFRLLHDAYVDAGFMQPHPSGLRVNAYQLVPGFRTLIAVDRGAIVATCSIIPDSPLGLPMEKVFRLDDARKRTGGLAEVSAMAIAPSHRGRPARLVFPMIKFFYEYVQRDLGFGGVAFCLPPRHLHLYEALLCVRPLRQGPVESYGFAGGAPAAAGVLEFARSNAWGRRKYRGAAPERDLYRYCNELTLPHLERPRPEEAGRPVLAPETMGEIFGRRTGCLAALDAREREALTELYAGTEYAPVLDGRAVDPQIPRSIHG